MISFKEFLIVEQDVTEGVLRKGAIAAYAAQAKRHGDDAVKFYQMVRQVIAYSAGKTVDQKVEALQQALIAMSNGLISTRQQIGSVSAQVSSASL